MTARTTRRQARTSTARSKRSRGSRKIIAYLAASADGYIARPDGDVAWLDRPQPVGDYGMAVFYRSIDTVLLGRGTYDVGLKFGQNGYPGKQNYVFTHAGGASGAPNVHFVRDDLTAFVRSLRAAPGKDIWACGGAKLFAALLDAGELDELIVHLIPVLIGEGIPLLAPRHRHVQLRLRSTKRYPDGVVKLHYAVITRSSR